MIKRPRFADKERERSTALLGDLFTRYFSEAPSVKRALEEEGGNLADTVSFESMLTNKSTNTLLKRACSLKMYSDWFATTGHEARAFAMEPIVFAYVKFLYTDKAPASRAQALREALNFSGGILALDFSDLQKSMRVKGMCCRMLRTRQVARQRAPLTVPMVRALEELLAREAELGSRDAVVSASALFALYARGRIGDLRRCMQEPKYIGSADRKDGFLETFLVEHKTAQAGSTKALPVAAPINGVTQNVWGEHYVIARTTAATIAEDGSSLIPAFTEEGPATVPYRTSEFASALRQVLVKLGFQAEIADIGAHSLKCTALSWAAKWGVAREHRRLLGYHAAPGKDRMVDLYARDALAVPLRELSKVIDDIRLGRFDPDETATGRFIVPAPEPVIVVGNEDEEEPEEALEDEDLESDTSAGSSDTEAATGDDEPESPVGTVVVKNCRTYIHHLADGEGGILRCGKKWPLKADVMRAPPAGAVLCMKCF